MSLQTYSRETLQSFSKEFEESQTQQFINNIVEDVKNSILVKAYNDSPNKTPTGAAISAKTLSNKEKPKMLKLNLPLQPSAYSNHVRLIYTPPYSEWNNFVPIILERLQQQFPGVTFQVDPLETYLLVDWS